MSPFLGSWLIGGGAMTWQAGPGTCVQDDWVSVLSFCKGKGAQIWCSSQPQRLPGTSL